MNLADKIKFYLFDTKSEIDIHNDEVLFNYKGIRYSMKFSSAELLLENNVLLIIPEDGDCTITFARFS